MVAWVMAWRCSVLCEGVAGHERLGRREDERCPGTQRHDNFRDGSIKVQGCDLQHAVFRQHAKRRNLRLGQVAQAADVRSKVPLGRPVEPEV